MTGQLKTACAFALAAAVLVLVFWLSRILLLIFLGLLLAILLDWLAELGMRWLHLGRGVAVVLATALFLGVSGSALVLMALPVAKQATQFVQDAPRKLVRFQQWVERARQQFPWMDRLLLKQPSEGSEGSGLNPPDLAKKALFTLSTVLDGMATALGVFFLGVFFALDPRRWARGIAELWPAESVEKRFCLLQRVGAGLRSYLISLGLYILAMGAAWSLGLWLIGIDYPLLLGTVGGLAEVVPYVGPIVGLIPALVLAFSEGTREVLLVLVLYGVLHVLEGYVLIPFFMHRREHLPPPLLLISIMVCGELFGLLGVLLAVPLATAAYVVANETIYGGQCSVARSRREQPGLQAGRHRNGS